MADKKYQITEDQIHTIIEWAHSYGRSMQFNYGLFGHDCEQAKQFTLDKATEYIDRHVTDKLCEL